MRKTVKVIAGWLHVTLVLAILPPLLYAMSVTQRSEASRTLYIRCLLIAFPVIAAGKAAERGFVALYPGAQSEAVSLFKI